MEPCTISDSYRHVGFEPSNPNAVALFSDSTLDLLQRAVLQMTKREILRGVIVPKDTIKNVLDSVYTDFRPATGDVYSRYTVPVLGISNNSPYDYILAQVVRIITADVVNSLGREAANASLTVWDTVLGDFNSRGLRSHPPIKVRENKPPSAMFLNLRY